MHGRVRLSCPGRALNQRQALLEGRLNSSGLRGVEGACRVIAEATKASTDARRGGSRCLRVVHLSQQEVAKRRAVVRSGIVQTQQRIGHPIVRHTVGATIKAPDTVTHAFRTLSYDDPHSGRSAVEDQAFHGFLAPWPRSAKDDHVAVREAMNGQASTVPGLEHQDWVAKEAPTWTCFEVVQGQTSINQTRLAPVPPTLFDGGEFILQLLTDEVREALQMVLSSVPADRSGAVVHRARLRRST